MKAQPILVRDFSRQDDYKARSNVAMLTEDLSGHGTEVFTARLINAAGSDMFLEHLMWMINQLCGADACGVHEYSLSPSTLHHRYVAAMYHPDKFRAMQEGSVADADAWRRDEGFFISSYESIQSQRGRCALDYKDANSLMNYPHVLRDLGITEAVIACGAARTNRLTVLSIQGLHRQGQIAEGKHKLSNHLPIIFAAIAKHEQLRDVRAISSSSQTALRRIKLRIEALATTLSGREVQVCAKILAGATTTEIADELQISAETILYYRKRVYLKLGVNSQHDLLCWYIKGGCQPDSADAGVKRPSVNS